MSVSDADFIRYRLARAREALEEAQLLEQAGHHLSAISRLYYACFYAASALLRSEGLSASSHGGVATLLHTHWVVSGRLPRSMGRFYHRMFVRRQQSDYGETPDFGRAEAEAWLPLATEFVQTIENLLSTET